MQKINRAIFSSRIRERILLSGPGSTKETYHLTLDVTAPYRPGDSLAVLPPNDPALRNRPRLYSIASSQLTSPHEAHLLVTLVTYEENGQLRHGVVSHFLCKSALVGETNISCFIQPTRNFALPHDPSTPVIFICAGTGIAPFRAFMLERQSIGAEGKNWLFFGERNRASDFYYQEFWENLSTTGLLRLDCAFSRDSSEKIYVQHRLFEHRRELWAWIQQGAVLYVCGDVHRMAKDVDQMLHTIAKSVGGYSDDQARAFLKSLRAEKRYLLDVY